MTKLTFIDGLLSIRCIILIKLVIIEYFQKRRINIPWGGKYCWLISKLNYSLPRHYTRSRSLLYLLFKFKFQDSECFEYRSNISGNDLKRVYLYPTSYILKGSVKKIYYFLIKFSICPLLNKYFVCALLRITTKYYVLCWRLLISYILFN